MGEGMEPVFHGGAVVQAFLEADEDSVSFSSDSREYSTGSSTLSDLTDDSSSPAAAAAAISPSSHPQLDACGPLYELSSLMEQLPIKRGGLSKFFSGKSQSFTSLSNARCVEDLAKKKETPHKNMRRMKPCRSYVGMLDLSGNNKTISKRSCPRGSCRRRSSSRGLLCCCSKPPPPLHAQKDIYVSSVQQNVQRYR